eukprot:gnl/TRDRNA2_/TRDRNA2_129537_c0_seq2.p1 gnl/TRDRNA2_/TRDRNA2_129537_c0~~gnl/TRDRNA2_/TRDRNA2_129537_c0_seq2.p1  ORF type:complete len:260 (-),score=49.55 gnl/TRDRNA2_/TRDRNA2_129537_c0_seq2:215-994(-)
MRLPWIGAGYTKLSEEQPPLPRRLVVRLQALRMAPGALESAATQKVTTEVTLGVVGGTSVEFRYRVLYGETHVGDGVVLMVCVGGKSDERTGGKLSPTPMPARVKSLAPEGARGGPMDRSAVLADMKAVRPTAPAEGPECFVYKVVIRYSDEDVNKHANHSAYARFCEDALDTLRTQPAHPLHKVFGLAAGCRLVGLTLEYAAESRAGDEVEVRFSPGARAAGDEATPIDVHIFHGATILNRGRLTLCTAEQAQRRAAL